MRPQAETRASKIDAIPQSPTPWDLMQSIFESALQSGEPIDARPKPSHKQ
jgi:hypothetical protein